MTKPYKIYIALTRAVDDYCLRHDITRGCFALRVGWSGPSAQNQISNHLNPNSEKPISHAREQRILQELDDRARDMYFSMRKREFELGCTGSVKVSVILKDIEFHTLADDAMIEADEAFAAIKKGLKNGSLSKKEIKALRKEAVEAASFYQKIVDAADAKLEVL